MKITFFISKIIIFRVLLEQNKEALLNVRVLFSKREAYVFLKTLLTLFLEVLFLMEGMGKKC